MPEWSEKTRKRLAWLTWIPEVASALKEIEEQAEIQQEYISKTDPMLFCSEDLTCGECRGCLMDKLDKTEQRIKELEVLLSVKE